MEENRVRSSTLATTSFSKVLFASLLALVFSTSSADAGMQQCLAGLNWPVCGDSCSVAIDWTHPQGDNQLIDIDCDFTALHPNNSTWNGSCSEITFTTDLQNRVNLCANACGTYYQACPTPPPPPCACSSPADCQEEFGDPSPGGSWDCRNNCYCMPNFSPLVIHLPDYFSSVNGNQNWWKKGFCGPQAPTVCLDWLGDGVVTCTGWTAPESEIAFVVALSDDDMLSLADGYGVIAEPWRHFFGNVTKGPEGNLPYVHGFEALAAHCSQDPAATSEIDLTECGLSLHVWTDNNSDGDIAADELLDFQDLGVDSLGDVRRTGKKDQCGNTFPFESHATCAGHPGNGRCGTWLDVFFEAR